MNKIKQLINYLSSNKKKDATISIFLAIIVFIVVQILVTTGNISSLFKGLLVPLCSYIVAALALNLTVGILGDLSLGQAGFMSVGAFTGIVVAQVLSQTIESKVLVLIIAIIAGTIVASLFGLIVGIPVLKLEGDYLAIVTLAFGQIIKSLIENLYVGLDSTGLKISFVNDTTNILPDGKMIINGPSGVSGNLRLSTFIVGFILILITLIIIYHLLESKSGRAILATRDNKIVALSVGIDTTKYKLMAFVISAALAGAAGVLYAMNYSALTPGKFDFNLSIMILVYVVLGGLGNMTGTMISTAVLLLLPEMLRELSDYRMLIYAIILILIMLVTNNDRIKKFIEMLKKKYSRKGANNG